MSGRLLAKAIVVMALCSGTSAIALDGVVIDADTRKPLAGVFVLATWKGQVPNPVDANTVCYHSEIATTDKEGRYQLSSFSGIFGLFLFNRRLLVSLYSPGREETEESRADKGTGFMTVDRRPAAEQFERLRSTWHVQGCHKNPKDLVPLLKALLNEFSGIASNRDQREALDSIRFSLEEIEIGPEAASRNAGRRMRERAKER